MKEPVIKEVTTTLRTGHYEPGNGTSYRAIAVRWRSNEPQQALGMVSNGWLVISCNTGLAYLFQATGALWDEYVAECLGGLLGEYSYFGDLIRALIQRPEPAPREAT